MESTMESTLIQQTLALMGSRRTTFALLPILDLIQQTLALIGINAAHILRHGSSQPIILMGAVLTITAIVGIAALRANPRQRQPDRKPLWANIMLATFILISANEAFN